MLRIAIIGTAGRGSDSDRLLGSDFIRMVGIARDIIPTITKDSCLVSGGAAWADHIAVRLFTEDTNRKLELHIPSAFECKTGKYIDTGQVNSLKNPGGISNYYHKKFSNKCSIDSLTELNNAIQCVGATIGTGFHERNTRVAKVDAVIAFTFGQEAKLKNGGTSNTFEKYLKRCTKNISYHVDLNTWKVYTPATL